MKAIEFIKKFGWKEAKLFVDENISAGDVYDNIDDNYVYVETNWTELKQYVDAYELVRGFGGIHMAKADSSDLDGFEKTSPYWVKVKQAITLVEEVENYNEKTKEGDPS